MLHCYMQLVDNCFTVIHLYIRNNQMTLCLKLSTCMDFLCVIISLLSHEFCLFKVEVHVNPSAPPSFLNSDLKPEHLEHLKVSII